MKKAIIIALTVIIVISVGIVLFSIFANPMVIPLNQNDRLGMNGDSDIIVSVEFPVYDKSCEYVTLLIENKGDKSIQFGDDWSLEKKVLGSWMNVPFRENVGFNSILRILEPGKTFAASCYLTIFNGDIGNGEYRIIKKIDTITYSAEFQIGESQITEKSPFGYTPVNFMGYDLEDAVGEGA